MGQCSTLPSEGRQSSSRRDDSSHRHRDKAKRNSFLQVQTQNGSSSNPAEFSPIQNHNMQQGRNPDAMSDGPEPMEEDNMREDIPQPPEIAIRTRCYKLNLDSNMFPPPSVFLGPFSDPPPPLTYSASDDSSANFSPVQIAIQTAKIFRGITVGKDGTILSQNARATRSNRGAKNKRGEKSRQATKIEKAKDLVEETIATGKAPDSDEPANMQSLVIMGEYDDMKYLVRDGSKKLREATELPDDSLLAINRIRDDMIKEATSPRKRGSPNYGSSQRNSGMHTPNKSRSTSGFSSGAPPKLKSHPRDRPSSRKEDKRRDSAMHDDSERGRDGDWGNALPVSFSRGFQNIWNCGATGEETGTISPTQVVSPRDGKSHSVGVHPTPHRPVFEGRDSHYAQARESGVTARAN
mmetsp:Transcript_13144/g.24665  ORF Transcript_13144/g.24665 Transcript_13144/m.24665 type:complete len:408 (+) Transcript_13144:358-1581(+)